MAVTSTIVGAVEGGLATGCGSAFISNLSELGPCLLSLLEYTAATRNLYVAPVMIEYLRVTETFNKTDS